MVVISVTCLMVRIVFGDSLITRTVTAPIRGVISRRESIKKLNEKAIKRQ